jgi:hypothetical protein
MSEVTAFITLLEALNIPDNEVRAAAEAEYERMKQTPSSRLPLLLLASLQHVAAARHIRVLSAVLLRRLLIQDENGYSVLGPAE